MRAHIHLMYGDGEYNNQPISKEREIEKSMMVVERRRWRKGANRIAIQLKSTSHGHKLY